MQLERERVITILVLSFPLVGRLFLASERGTAYKGGKHLERHR